MPERRALIPQIRRAWALVRARDRRRLVLVGVYSVLISGLDTLALLLLVALINVLENQPLTGIATWLLPAHRLTHTQRFHDALILLLFASVLFTVRSLLSVFGLWLTTMAAQAAQADLVARLLIGHARAPHLARLERNSSETLRTVSISIDQVTMGVVYSTISLVANGAVTIAVLLALVVSSPIVAVVTAVYFFLVAVAWVRGVRGGLRKRGEALQHLQAERFRLILQGFAAAKELQLRGRALPYADEAVARTREMNTASRGLNVVNGSVPYMLQTMLVIGAVIIVSVADVVGGRDSALTAVGLVMAAAFRLLPAISQVLYLINQVQSNGPAIDLVEHEVETFNVGADTPLDESEVEVEPLRLSSALRLSDVTFTYPTRPAPVLRGVSLTVNAGDSVGIVGPTGSGKSTLLDIILGFLPPATGSITVDGVPLHECRESWQRSIGYVPQDVYLIDDTIRANVALGWRGEEIDDDAVVEAIRLAQLERVVASLPERLDTIVGERGVRLSGGQRQRLGLARALYVRPTVLILDEATSNLDTSTEHRIVATLTELQTSLTTIVVTHRIPTVRDCDRIIYLENGVIQMTGTFADLTSYLASIGDTSWRDRVTASAGG